MCPIISFMCTIGTDRTGFSPASRNCSALPPPYLFHRPPQKKKKNSLQDKQPWWLKKSACKRNFMSIHMSPYNVNHSSRLCSNDPHIFLFRTRLKRIFWAFFFPIPFIIFALLVLLPPSRNSDPGSHSRFFSPLPIMVRALHFFREKKFSTFFPRRLASTCAYPRYNQRSRQLVSFFR